MREGDKGEKELKSKRGLWPLPFDLLPPIIAAISYSSSGHVALSSRPSIFLRPRSARFQPSGLTVALHCISIIPNLSKDKAKWTCLVHIFVISARPWGLYLRYPSVTFSLRLLLLLGRKIEPGKCPISISACVWDIPSRKGKPRIGSHIHVRTSSRQIGTEAWDKRQANRQANIQAFTAYPFPPQLGTCFDWGSSCTQTLRLQSIHSLSRRPHLDVASGIHISILMYSTIQVELSLINLCMSFLPHPRW